MAPGLVYADLPESLRPRAREIVEAATPLCVARAAEFEFATFRVGTRPPPEMAEADPELVHDLRAVVRHELRLCLEAAWPGRRFDAFRADMIIDVRPWERGAGVWFEPQAAFVAGRYRKLSRDLSQTVFHCRRCRGRGGRRGVPCATCGGTGRMVPESVEEFVLPPLEEALAGRGATFHGSGREDVDVRMVGEGRPFVVTVEEPRRRTVDGADVATRVAAASGGRVEVLDLRMVGRDDLRRITTEHGEKAYRVVVRPAGDAALPADAAARLATLSGVTLSQRTPQRVGRRADLVRERTLREVVVERAAADEAVLRIATDPGLYVKELVSGDEGRTQPSVSAVLDVPCVCAELDVLGVRDADGGDRMGDTNQGGLEGP